MGRKVGERLKREWTYVYLWLIQVDVWQKPTQFCKAITLKTNKKEIIWVKRVAHSKSHQMKGRRLSFN